MDAKVKRERKSAKDSFCDAGGGNEKAGWVAGLVVGGAVRSNVSCSVASEQVVIPYQRFVGHQEFGFSIPIIRVISLQV